MLVSAVVLMLAVNVDPFQREHVGRGVVAYFSVGLRADAVAADVVAVVAGDGDAADADAIVGGRMERKCQRHRHHEKEESFRVHSRKNKE